MPPKNALEAYDFVKKRAKKHGLSIAAFCVSKGVSPSTVTRWKQERYEGYQIRTFIRLAE